MWVSVKAVLRNMEEGARVATRLENLPLTNQALTKVQESGEQFRLRAIKWAAVQLVAEAIR